MLHKVERVVGFISIHALREEGDMEIPARACRNWLFLSTPSARRATRALYAVFQKRKIFLSTPSARRATVGAVLVDLAEFDFYPRPPRGGRPAATGAVGCCWVNFYPRPPRGGRPVLKWSCRETKIISIHALREEGDQDAGRNGRVGL